MISSMIRGRRLLQEAHMGDDGGFDSYRGRKTGEKWVCYGKRVHVLKVKRAGWEDAWT